MKFRIRDCDDYEKNHQAYEAHLQEIKPKIRNSDLWRYFGWDFFGDGHIEEIDISELPMTLTMKIYCPNIQVFKSGDFRRYVNVSFTCIFHEVDLFQIDNEAENASEYIDNYSLHNFQYLAAEIDTLKDRMITARKRWYEQNEDYEENEKPEFHSLIIETVQSYYFALVFSSMKVIADEPIAFEMMLKDKDFKVPLRGDED